MTVTGIPADLPDVGVGQAVREMLSEFRESERLSPDDRIRRTAAVMARCGAMTSRDAMDAEAAGSFYTANGSVAKDSTIRRRPAGDDGADRRRIG